MTEQSLTAVSAAELRRARRALLIVGVAAPVVITAVAVALIAIWLPELPDPAATHWGVDGVNGVGLGIPLLLVLCTLVAARDQWGGAARLLGGMALGLSGFSAITNVGSVAMQRGLSDASQAGGVGALAIASFAAMILLAALGWVLQPHVHPVPAAPLQPVHLASISAGERVVWMATASMSRVSMIVISLVVVIVVGITAVMVVQAGEQAWIPAVTLVIVGLAFASSASFRVKAGPDGLRVRSLLGVPRVHVPLEEIVSVRAVDCNPFGEFGGFGWRLGLDGRTGIVLRRGPAIEVQRRDKRPLVVTVDGADVAAGVLQAYLDRRATAGSPRDPESER
ncbi:MAG: DUF1648 domain-containing protein [Microbacterium sp.]|nr:DUF1648 domain-containing protein [Microbacterium sp.]